MATQTLIPSPAALADHAGAQLGPSDWVAVTQERIDAFAGATGDHQWIHCDVQRAQRESPWKGTIAHGYLTLSLTPVLLAQLIAVGGCKAVINSGVEKLRLAAPVPSGARVRLHAVIRNVRGMPGGGVRVTFGLRMEVEGSAKPACTGDVVYVYLP
ncbi:MAG: MaoC family dehydratase [Myxococcota bacterium]